MHGVIADRNRAWADELERALNEETGVIFVAVGAAHLVGDDAVQALLERRGFEASRL
ncbi:MAG: TraB/GumN family protein [Pseudomonadota bacterium]